MATAGTATGGERAVSDFGTAALRIAQEVAAPKLISIVAGGLTPDIDRATLAALGFAIAIYPTTALLAAADAAPQALAGLASSDAVLPSATMEDFFRLVGLEEWLDLGDRWRAPGE